MQPPMRKIFLVVSLFVSTAWAQEAVVAAEAAPEAPRHALWLHTAFTTQSPGAALGYEHWFTRSISLQLSLGGSYSQSAQPFSVINTDGTIRAVDLTTNIWAASTSLQLRWHLASGVFFAESLALQWQRSVTVGPAGSLGSLSAAAFGGTDSSHFFEAVLAGWGHTFGSGLRFELYAGPMVSLGLSGSAADSMSTKSITVGYSAGVGLGYAF
jgi:hypothetical protein